MCNDLQARRVLWGVGTSRTMRPHWTLHELSLPYETNAIGSRTGETQSERFSALNPRQKIPVLKDGDFTITESFAIAAYLAETYSGGILRLVPSGHRERARWLEWNFFIAMELDATSLYVVRRHHELSHIYGEALAAVEAGRDYFLKQLVHIDQTLRSEGPFLMGDNFTTADILLTTCLTWATRLGVPLSDCMLDYLQRVTSRPAYLLALQSNAVATQRL